MSNIQIGGMLGFDDHEDAIETIQGPLVIENVKSALTEEASDRSEVVPDNVKTLLKKPMNDTSTKQTFIDYIKSLFKVTFAAKKSKNNFLVTLDNTNEVNKKLEDIEKSDFSTNNIISIRVGYRTKSKEAIMNRINGSGILALNILNIIKLISRLVDNSDDGCGGLGTKCFYLGELFSVFNEITLHMIKQGFQPIGQLNMANEFAYMTFHKQPVAVSSGSPAPASAVTSIGGGIKKMKKRSKKKRQSNH